MVAFFFTRFMRLFAYGSLSVVLVFYLSPWGSANPKRALLLTLTLAGDVVVALSHDSRGSDCRRRMLIVEPSHGGRGPGVLPAPRISCSNYRRYDWLISPSGNEVGPFSRLNKRAFSRGFPAARTEVLRVRANRLGWRPRWGRSSAGTVTHALQRSTLTPVGTYRVVVVLYAVLGVLLAYFLPAFRPRRK